MRHIETYWVDIKLYQHGAQSSCRQVTREKLLACIGRYRCVIDQRTRDVVSCLQLRRRGCRAGDQYPPCPRRLVRDVTSGSTSHAREIPTVIGNRRPSDVNNGQLFHGCRDVRVTASKTVPRRSFMDVIRLGLFNARSVAGKCAAIPAVDQ